MPNPTQMTSMRVPTETLTAAKTLLPGDSGKTFLLALAGGFTVTLPPVADAKNGWSATFIVKVNPTTAYIVTETAASDTNVLTGGVVERETDTADDGPYSAAFTQVNFVANTAVLGDIIRVVCDGVRYYIDGQVNADGAITLT